MSLRRYLDVGAYADTALAMARGDIDTLAQGHLLIRLCLVLQQPHDPMVPGIIARLTAMAPVGYALFQLCTARIIAGLDAGDANAVQMAVDQWLTGRESYPTNWDNSVLDAAELQPFLVGIAPDRLATPVVPSPVLTPADHMWIRDLPSARLQAVMENLPWLRQMGIRGTPKALAKRYVLFSVNRDLSEATIAAQDLPSIIIALSPDGDVLGSFLSH
jgi:hypothetical protein